MTMMTRSQRRYPEGKSLARKRVSGLGEQRAERICGLGEAGPELADAFSVAR